MAGTERAAHAPADPTGVLDAVIAILGHRDLDGVIGEALDAARRLTGARYAALGVLAADGATLGRFTTSGLDPETERAIGDRPRGRGVLGLLIRDPRPIRLADIGAHPQSYGFPLNHPPMRSFLGVPLVLEGVPWGSLYLTDKQGADEFTEEDERNLVTLAEVTVRAATLTADDERLRERIANLQRDSDAFTASMEIARALAGEPDLDRMMELVAKRARALTNARGVTLLRIDGDRLITAVAAGDTSGSTVAEVTPLAAAPLVAGALRRGCVVRVDAGDAAGDHLRARMGASAAMIAPLILHRQQIGAVVCVDRLEGGPDFTERDEVLLAAFGASAALALGSAQFAEAKGLRRALAASERERTHWARELHDETLQELAAIKLLVGLAERADGADSRSELLGQALEQLDAAAGDLRSLITDLRPAALDALGFASAIETLIERLNRQYGISIVFEREGIADAVDGAGRYADEIEGVVYRVVQEALTNACRHSGAGHITVRLDARDGALTASVEDDGRGFDAMDESDGFGLLGIRERAELVDGDIRLESGAGIGTRVTLVVPIVGGPPAV